MGLLDKIFGTYSERELKKIYPIRDKVLALDEPYQKLSDAELRANTDKLKARLANGETLDDILPEAFATCREAAWRVLGKKHYPVQIVGGIVLHQGRIAEMKTGEGKTLVETLPVYLNALEGKGVHVVTVNDYLAKRDSEEMGKIYRFLGLTVGLIVHGADQGKKDAYDCDITYGTNSEFGFDYLRDNMQIKKEKCVQRGHHYAVVDEVDSILIDEARTPLIISGAGDKSTDLYTLADRFARTLTMTKVREVDTKEDMESTMSGDYIVDEKGKTATLTKSGIEKAERYFNVENLMDIENSTLQHHINQAIKAHGTMHKDVNYLVQDGQVKIVDEFTGRVMEGRRWSEGLHQAVEAKEGVEIKKESKTLATVTYQNLFRMYDKLSGMTGTAMTEADEFREIYGMDVIEVPTNKPVIRLDLSDVVFKNENAKINAIIEQIKECHAKGQPVLVGTVSVEKSEQLSAKLKRTGIQHQVLNAKYHEKEAEIVAQAGQFGAVTIATNMAGRGTDIMLGGNAEFMARQQMRKEEYTEELIMEAMGFGETEDEAVLSARQRYNELIAEFKEKIAPEAEKVCNAGGLFIIGTERHESRRVDNQLRGRSGRQGDPGASRFFLSLDDDLMRLFGGDRINNMMDSLKIDENLPIENKMLTNTIESAQTKIEARNFGIRKNVLQYDDVMNKQRQIIYAQRNQVLDGADMKDYIQSMISEQVQTTIPLFLHESTEPSEWNIVGLKSHFVGMLAADLIPDDPNEAGKIGRESLTEQINQRLHEIYEEKEAELGSDVMRELERVVLLKQVDTHWIDHLSAMEDLKQGIGLRSFAQRDPATEYRMEGFDMFDEMIAGIREDTVKYLFAVKAVKPGADSKLLQREQVAKPLPTGGDGSLNTTTVVRKGKKIGRNDPCPCGSGKKYKHCCGR